MYLSVQLAARRLGVSPHTIRRWTSSGLLPCTRTAGGHRRIRQEDIDELAQHVGARNRLNARLIRERDMATLADTTLAVTNQMNATELMQVVARRLSALLDAQCCIVTELDPSSRTFSLLADYDEHGKDRPAPRSYALSQVPSALRAIENRETVVVNVSDPEADPSEVAIMRRHGHRCLLMIPLLYQEEATGLLEVFDHVRERQFSRQELRLAHTVACQAAVALHNARMLAELQRSHEDVAALRRAVERLSAGCGELHRAATGSQLLQAAVALAADALSGLCCVASCGADSAGASGLQAAQTSAGATRSNPAHVIVSSAPCGDDTLTLTLTRAAAAGEGLPELLGLIATMAAEERARRPHT